ncbi:hypothetical protein BgiMline_031325, partial [Biomphalaria glabrata]
ILALMNFIVLMCSKQGRDFSGLSLKLLPRASNYINLDLVSETCCRGSVNIFLSDVIETEMAC